MLVYGRSLGSGFATKIAADNMPHYLILDAPISALQTDEGFTFSSASLASAVSPENRPLDKQGKLPYVHHPWNRDRLIPINIVRTCKVNPHKITLIRIMVEGIITCLPLMNTITSSGIF